MPPTRPRAASAVVASHAFLSLYSAPPTTAAGRARLLDGSCSRGPFSFWRRVPVPAPDPTDPPLFAFAHPDAYWTALAQDLLLLPPLAPAAAPLECPDCARSGRPAVVHLDGRHVVSCPWGLLQSSCCHDVGLAALVAVLDAVWGRRRVLADHLTGRRHAFEQWWAVNGEGTLHHRPDVVLVDWHGPRTFLVFKHVSRLQDV